MTLLSSVVEHVSEIPIVIELRVVDDSGFVLGDTRSEDFGGAGASNGAASGAPIGTSPEVTLRFGPELEPAVPPVLAPVEVVVRTVAPAGSLATLSSTV